MGFLSPDRWFGVAATPARRASTPSPLHDSWYGDVYRDPVSGFMVGGAGGEDLALTLSAFWRGVSLIAGNVAACKCEVFRRETNGNEHVAQNHPVADLVGHRPNAYMTAFGLWEMCAAHLLLRGRFFARIVPDLPGRGAVGELRPIHPDLVTVDLLPSSELQFTVRDLRGGRPALLGSEDVFYVRGLSLDGIHGVSVIRYGAHSIGVMQAAERFAGRFFKAGATASLAVVHPEELGDDGLDNLHKSVMRFVSGLENAFGVLPLEEDVKVVPNLGLSPEDSQLLATRQFSRQHVADWLGMHIAALGDPATQSYASTRQFRQDLVDLTFRPFVERIEGAINTQLLLAPQIYSARFNLWEIFRGNPKEQADVDHIYVQDGVRTRNEVRRDHRWNRLPGLDDPLTPLNMDRGPADRSEGRAERGGLTRAQLMTVAEAKRLVLAERTAVTRLAKQYADDAAGWQSSLRAFYAEHAERVAERLMMPLVLAREYAARQGLALADHGVAVMADWEWTASADLANLALCADLRGRAAALEQETTA